MLPKNKRITKDLFQNIMKNGRMVSTPLFTFRYLPKQQHNQSAKGAFPTNNETKYSFVAPKKIAKTAVLRNKLRRKGYNIIRSLPEAKISIKGIFFYKKSDKSITNNEMRNDIKYIINRINN